MKASTTDSYKKAKSYPELEVVAKAKELAGIVFEVCERAPKKFRLDFLPAMRNAALEIVRNINRANETYIDIKLVRDINKTITAAAKQTAQSENTQGFEQLRLFVLKLAKAFKHEERVGKRLDHCFEALNLCKELDFLITLGTANQAVTSRQRERLAGMLENVRNMIGAYIKANKRQYGYE